MADYPVSTVRAGQKIDDKPKMKTQNKSSNQLVSASAENRKNRRKHRDNRIKARKNAELEKKSMFDEKSEKFRVDSKSAMG